MQRVTALIFGLMMSASALADRQAVDETKAAKPDGFVMVSVIRGEVRITGWDRNEVKVEGLLDEKLEQFVFEVNEEETRIEVRIPRDHGGWGGRSGSDIHVHVPRSSHVDFSGVSTDVDVREVAGSVEIGTVSGDITLVGGRDRVELQTVSGEIQMRGTVGRMRINSVSGDIESYDSTGQGSFTTISGDVLVENGGEELEIESVSGNLEVVNEMLTVVKGHSVSGDIEVTGKLRPEGDVEFDNVSGSIRLNLQGAVNARFDLETGSGSIRNRLSDDKPKASRYIRDEHLRFELGDGSAEVILNTRSGDIMLSDR